MSNLITVATEMAAAFETRTRDNGDTFRCLKDDAPEWMTDVCHAGHGDMMPDDWRYRMIEAACDAIAEGADDSHEAADSFVPIYNGDRLEWLASNLTRTGYCDDAANEGLVAADATILDRIAAGIYAEFQEAFAAVLEALEGEAETRDDDSEEG
jgi:hypothetical protein